MVLTGIAGLTHSQQKESFRVHENGASLRAFPRVACLKLVTLHAEVTPKRLQLTRLILQRTTLPSHPHFPLVQKGCYDLSFLLCAKTSQVTIT